jgi:hypothetical protein
MSDLEKVKAKVIRKYAVQEAYIKEEEWKKLSKEEKKYCSAYAPYIPGEYVYRSPLNIPPEELDSFLALKSFEAQMETKNAIITIKNIVVFIFVLSIIASIVLFFLQTQRF